MARSSAPARLRRYDEGGQLTEAVRRRPYSVLLLDEVEKAHSDVFNVLLQVLDDGRLTDGQGRTVDFRNTVLIMTSNLGSHIYREYERPEKVRPLIMQELRNTLRPEFLNRIDEIVVFMPLGREHIDRIVEIQLGHLRRRLAGKRIDLEVSDTAKALLAREGYDPTFGARPLKRTIQRLVQDPLALKILEGEFVEGDTVRVDAEGTSRFSAGGCRGGRRVEECRGVFTGAGQQWPAPWPAAAAIGSLNRAARVPPSNPS